MYVRKVQPYVLMLILIALAVSPAFALGEGNRNLLLIGIMSFSPIIVLYYKKFYKNEWLLLLFMATIILFPNIIHPESMRWSTVLYSIMFCLTFMTYQRLLRQNKFRAKQYKKLLRYLIYAYFSVLLLQQFCVLVGLPIFNMSNYDPAEPWKLNALAAEPSHSARIMALLMFCYITISELILKRKYIFKTNIKRDKWVWLAFIWTMTTMGSGTAILFLAIVLLKFIRFKKFTTVFIIGFALFFLIDYFELKTFNRTKDVFLATLTLDEEAILLADHSAGMRIVPSIVVAKMITVNSLDSWFGKGVDFTGSFLSDRIPGLPEGASGGGMFQIWLEYGFVSFSLFVVFSLFTTFSKGDYLSLLFWFFLVFIYGVNNQIVWLCIVLLFTNRYFLKTKKIKSIYNGKTDHKN